MGHGLESIIPILEILGIEVSIILEILEIWVFQFYPIPEILKIRCDNYYIHHPLLPIHHVSAYEPKKQSRIYWYCYYVISGNLTNFIQLYVIRKHISVWDWWQERGGNAGTPPYKFRYVSTVNLLRYMRSSLIWGGCFIFSSNNDTTFAHFLRRVERETKSNLHSYCEM